MLRRAELRWRKRGSANILVGKVAGSYVWVEIKRYDVGQDESAYDLPYAIFYQTKRKPFDGQPDVPD
jgi:uncharacterized protein with LGFP repeats